MTDYERIAQLLMGENKQLKLDNRLLRAQVNYWQHRAMKAAQSTWPPLAENPDVLHTPALLRRQAE